MKSYTYPLDYILLKGEQAFDNIKDNIKPLPFDNVYIT